MPFFPAAFAHFVSVSYFWWFLQYSKLFHHYYIHYGDLWLVIFDVTIVIAGVVELARGLKLEVEPEDVTELLQSHDKTLKDEEVLFMDEESGFLRWNYFQWRCCQDCWNDNKGFRILHKLSWQSSSRVWEDWLVLKAVPPWGKYH